MFPKPAGTRITTQHSLQKFICCWLGSQIRAFGRTFYLSTQQCNTGPTASAPTEELERAGLREKCVSTHLCHQTSGLLWDLVFFGTGPVSCMPAWVKRKHPGTMSRQPVINYEGDCIWKSQSVFPRDRIPVWRRKSSVQLHVSGHFPDTTAPSWQSGRISVHRERPLQGCMSAVCEHGTCFPICFWGQNSSLLLCGVNVTWTVL